MTFWSTDEQLCHLWLQTLRELLEELSTCAREGQLQRAQGEALTALGRDGWASWSRGGLVRGQPRAVEGVGAAAGPLHEPQVTSWQQDPRQVTQPPGPQLPSLEVRTGQVVEGLPWPGACVVEQEPRA